MTAEIEMNSSNLLKKIYLSIFLFIFAHERPAKRRKNIFHFFGLLIYCTFLKGESCNLIVMFKAHVLLAQTLSLKVYSFDKSYKHSSFEN